MSFDKYEVQRTMKFNGRSFERGDAISHDLIVGVAPEKLGTLLRTKYIAPAATALSDLSMGDLRDHARDVGVTGPLPRSKADLVDAIESEM